MCTLVMGIAWISVAQSKGAIFLFSHRSAFHALYLFTEFVSLQLYAAGNSLISSLRVSTLWLNSGLDQMYLFNVFFRFWG